MTDRTAGARCAGVRLFTTLAALLALSACAAPARADAGELHVHSGALPDGTPTRVGPWSGLSIGAPDLTGSYGVRLGIVSQGTSTTATLSPPSGLSIAAATIDRGFDAPSSPYNSQPQVQTSWENRAYPFSGLSQAGGYLGESDSGLVSVSAPGGLFMTVSCVNFDGIFGTCIPVSHTIRRLDLTLRDADAPTISGSASGTLLSESWQTAADATLRVVAADSGSGVYRAFIREGGRTWYAAADPDSTRCRDAYAANDTPYDFVPSTLSLVPCATAPTQFDPHFDLTRLGDGVHVVSIGIEDASGNERTIETARVLRVNTPGGALGDPGTACSGGLYDAAGDCQPTGGGGGGAGGGGGTGGAGGVTPVPSAPGASTSPISTGISSPPPAPGPLPAPIVEVRAADGARGNGDRATAAAKMTVRVGGATRTRLTVGYGRTITATGTLATANGQPIAGATIDVATTRRGATTRGSGLVTDASGAFRVVLAAGPSRTVRFGYRAFAGDEQDADSATLEVDVRTRVRLSGAPHRLRNGHLVTLGGTVSGAPKHSRKLIELQVRQGARWLTFATTRLHNGRFSYRYRFTRTKQTTRYVFRIVVPVDSSWPYATGASNHVAVTVRP